MIKLKLTSVLLIIAIAFPRLAHGMSLESAPSSIDNLHDSIPASVSTATRSEGSPRPISPYLQPYSLTSDSYDWHRLWINTATLSGAFVGTLLVLECLPEDATTWNRAELRDVPLFKRWRDHVLKEGPEWDHDKFYFNYILHPYAGAAYFMSARSCGFNFWKSTLYCTIISTVGWEFGIEAFMERPSIQDIFVTPIVGSCIGEGFYRLKRWLVSNDYRFCGSSFLGGMLAFLIDPVNEFTGLWLGNPARKFSHTSITKEEAPSEVAFVPTVAHGYKGFSLIKYF